MELITNKTAIAAPYSNVDVLKIKVRELLNLPNQPQIWTGRVELSTITVPTVTVLSLPNPDFDLRPFRTCCDNVAFIVVGDSAQHAALAWEIHAARYCSNSQMNKLPQAYRLAQKTLQMRQALALVEAQRIGEYIELPVEGAQRMRVIPSSILYCEAQKDYTWCFFENEPEKPVEIRLRLGKVEEQLAPFGFERTHRSYLVNSMYIALRCSGYVTLSTGQRIRVGRGR